MRRRCPVRCGRAARGAVLAAALALAPALAPAQPVTLDPGTLRDLALAAERAGALDTAAAYADALIARDPADVTARIVASRVARERGDLAAARGHARAAWAAAEAPGERYVAAMTRAQVLASDGSRTAALLWLRRAGDLAPTPAARSVALRDFQYVRARNRLTVDLSFAVAPSSNVNNGSRHSTITLFGEPFTLSPAARALSGGAVTAGATLTWRLAEHETARTDLRVAGSLREVWIADPAGAGVNPSDYDYAVAEIGIDHRRRPGAGPVQLTFGATLGHNRFGGQPLSDYLRLEASVDRPLAGGRHVMVGLGAEKQWRADSARRDAEVVSLRAGLVQRLASGDRLRVEASARGTFSAADEVSHSALGLRLGWQKAAPVAGVRVDVGLGLESRDYGRVPLAPAGRQDLRLDAELSLTFERFDVMGFAPVLDLRASRAASTVTLYDGFDLGVSLGIRSVF